MENIHDILLYSLSELVMQTLIENEMYNVSHCGLSFDSFEIKNDEIIYYFNGKQVYLNDNEVLEEIWID